MPERVVLMGDPIRFGHYHKCPKCGAVRLCPARIPYLQCAASDYCDECSSLDTTEAQ